VAVHDISRGDALLRRAGLAVAPAVRRGTGSVKGEPPITVGDVLELAEADYRFGVGPLTLRVTALLHVQVMADGPWLYLRGIAIRPDGSDGESRQILVRLSALRRRQAADQPRDPRD
jgi:hypothetical protein